VDDAGLSRVISRLQLGNVDNVSAHAGCGHKAAICVVLQLVSLHIRSLLLLTSPVDAGSPSTVVGAIEIGSDNFAVVVDLSVQHCSLSPWDTGIGNEDVQTAVEFFDNVVNRV